MVGMKVKISEIVVIRRTIADLLVSSQINMVGVIFSNSKGCRWYLNGTRTSRYNVAKMAVMKVTARDCYGNSNRGRQQCRMLY